jgi:hypothetical protein
VASAAVAHDLVYVASQRGTLTALEMRTGIPRWSFAARQAISASPVVAGDVVYFAAFSAESDPGQQELVPPFEEALAKWDTNKDGKLSKQEIPDPRAKSRFEEYLDLDRTGFLEERDWRQFQERRQGESSVRAYRLGGQGDVTESHFLWKNPRSLPNVPSPLFYRGVLYTQMGDMAKARAELRQLRHMVAGIVARYGLGILAAGTHPTAAWCEAQQTKAERYDNVMHDLQMIGRRNMLCGMHVHVELPDPDARVDVMTRMLPYLPIFIALATSSPFWQSRRTGLLGYRLAAYDELPRTASGKLDRRALTG